MLRLESYVRAALEHASMSIHHPACAFPRRQKDCSCHVGKAKFALSLYTHGHLHAPLPAELKEELGENWVLARRSPNIVRRYGEDVRCYSQKAYTAGEVAALRKRMARMGVEPFEPAPCASP